MVEFYLLLTFLRFPLRKKERKSYFGKNRTHDFRTSRCAAYLLDHSGDEHCRVKCQEYIGGVDIPGELERMTESLRSRLLAKTGRNNSINAS